MFSFSVAIFGQNRRCTVSKIKGEAMKWILKITYCFSFDFVGCTVSKIKIMNMTSFIYVLFFCCLDAIFGQQRRCIVSKIKGEAMKWILKITYFSSYDFVGCNVSKIKEEAMKLIVKKLTMNMTSFNMFFFLLPGRHIWSKQKMHCQQN